MTIKQHGGVFGRNPSFNDASVETLSIAGTALSSTAAELNILDGVTADATELNYLDGASTSVVTASKAVLANASANIAFASGKGIDFSATAGTGTSELFDDYEEGTWTPAFSPASGSFTTMTYSSASGDYVKIGRYVFLTTVLSTSNVDVTGASGSLYITGLPFTPTVNSYAGSVGFVDRWNLSSDILTPKIWADTSGRIRLQKQTMNASSGSEIAVTELQSGAGGFRNEIYFGMHYIA